MQATLGFDDLALKDFNEQIKLQPDKHAALGTQYRLTGVRFVAGGFVSLRALTLALLQCNARRCISGWKTSTSRSPISTAQ